MVKNVQCYSYGVSLWKGKKPRFMENAAADSLNCIFIALYEWQCMHNRKIITYSMVLFKIDSIFPREIKTLSYYTIPSNDTNTINSNAM